MKKTKKWVAAFAVILLLGATSSISVQGKSLGDIFGNTGEKILKGAGLIVLTNVLSEQLNDFINTVTFNKGVPPEAATKVVPILAFGSGTRAGAAQVSGPRELVEKVKVVVQIETKFSQKNLDVEIFVPSDSMNPLKFNRVEGVGVSAIIDLRLSGI